MNDTFTLTLPKTLLVEFRDEVGNREVRLDNKSPEWFLAICANGLRQSIADAIAGKAGTEEGRKAILAKYDRVCVQGLVPAGGSGGGSRLTAESAGWIAYFGSKDSPVIFKGEKPNGKNLDKYLDALTRKAIWPSVQSHLATLGKEDQVTFHKEKLPALIEKYKPTIIEREGDRTDKGSPGWFIQVEKDKREGKEYKDSTVTTISIVIE